jgi:hypothetical protein
LIAEQRLKGYTRDYSACAHPTNRPAPHYLLMYSLPFSPVRRELVAPASTGARSGRLEQSELVGRVRFGRLHAARLRVGDDRARRLWTWQGARVRCMPYVCMAACRFLARYALHVRAHTYDAWQSASGTPACVAESIERCAWCISAPHRRQRRSSAHGARLAPARAVTPSGSDIATIQRDGQRRQAPREPGPNGGGGGVSAPASSKKPSGTTPPTAGAASARSFSDGSAMRVSHAARCTAHDTGCVRRVRCNAPPHSTFLMGLACACECAASAATARPGHMRC